MDNPVPKPIIDKVLPYEYSIVKHILLEVPKQSPQKDFFEVLQKRKSEHSFQVINIEKLSKILWFGAKVKHARLQDNGYILSHRAAPSAGARHPIDILVFSPCLNNGQIPHYYNPFDHSLNELLCIPDSIFKFYAHLNEAINVNNATILWFVAQPSITGAKYENEESLVLRDAGALIYCLQLVCTALDINSCPLGSLGQPLIQCMFENPKNLAGMGCIALG